MKLAIFADIHANLPALEAVLKDIDTQKPDRVIVNGDLINRGPSNVQVLERIRQTGFNVLLGNHDDLIRKWIERDESLPQAWFDDPFWAATTDLADKVAAENWTGWLRELPLTELVEIGDAPKILISHGSPRHYRDGYAPYTKQSIFDQVVAKFPADIYIGSHTHRSWQAERNGKLFLNSGAVGTPFNEDWRAQYLIAELIDNQWQFDFRRIEYDQQRALQDFHSVDFLEKGGLSGHIFYEELRLSRPLFDPFWRWTGTNGVGLTWELWREFQAEHVERFRKK